MYTVYILKSQKTGKRYIGYTNNFPRRFLEHNHATKGFAYRHKPYCMIYKEELGTRGEAMRREKYLKSLKGGNEFYKIIGGNKGS